MANGAAVAKETSARRVDSPKSQEQMTKQSHMHNYLNWAKERLDEMDATLALFESKVGTFQGDARAKAESALTDMRAKRDAFRETIRKEGEMTEADWTRAKVALEADWGAFEASVQKYIDAAGVKGEQQKAAFQVRADAQRKAWQEAIDKFENTAAGVAADRRADVDSAVKQMKADAAAAEAKLEKLKVAGTESWSSYRKALAETRTAFDHANQKAHDAFKGAK
ncbi:MAG TPA: hypothetical protein VLU73_00640 [Methylococcaceae bacterium]|nr:hypothetical protein [Methylococcaceae bacterium]